MEQSNFELINIKMIRGQVYGLYEIVAYFEAYGKYHIVKTRTADSKLWDDEGRTNEDLLNHIGGEQGLLERI